MQPCQRGVARGSAEPPRNENTRTHARARTHTARALHAHCTHLAAAAGTRSAEARVHGELDVRRDLGQRVPAGPAPHLKDPDRGAGAGGAGAHSTGLAHGAPHAVKGPRVVQRDVHAPLGLLPAAARWLPPEGHGGQDGGKGLAEILGAVVGHDHDGRPPGEGWWGDDGIWRCHYRCCCAGTGAPRGRRQRRCGRRPGKKWRCSRWRKPCPPPSASAATTAWRTTGHMLLVRAPPRFSSNMMGLLAEELLFLLRELCLE